MVRSAAVLDPGPSRTKEEAQQERRDFLLKPSILRGFLWHVSKNP